MQKTMYIGRHGEAPQRPEGGSEDAITPAGIVQLYEQGREVIGPLVSEHGLQPGNVEVLHTDKKRTRRTALARLAGGFDLRPETGELRGIPSPPQTEADLTNYDFAGFSVRQEPSGRFNIPTPGINLAVYKGEGPGANVNYWLAHPDATEHDGVAIARFTELQATLRAGLVEHIRRITTADAGIDLGMIVSHSPLIEIPIIGLINTGRNTSVGKVEDVGGMLDMAEFATLTVDGGSSKGTLLYKGDSHPVDLDKL